jgi:hypothetical protein
MTTPHKLVNGQVVPLSAEEIAQRQQDEIAWNNGAFDRAMADLRSKRNTCYLLVIGHNYQTLL